MCGLGQVWYFIVSIPDLRLPTHFAFQINLLTMSLSPLIIKDISGIQEVYMIYTR